MFYLQNDKLEHNSQLTNFSSGEIKQERRVPHSAGASFSFSAADHDALMMQVDHYLVFCVQLNIHVKKSQTSNVNFAII